MIGQNFSFRWLLVPFAATAMVAANWYEYCQCRKCSGAFRVTLVDGQNLLGLKVVSNTSFPGRIPRGFGFVESLRIQLGAFEVRRVDRLLRWAGSATILGLMVIGWKAGKPDGTK